MLRRLKDLTKFLKGDYVLLRVNKQTLIVEAERCEKEKLRELATSFFQHVYNL